MNATCNPKRRSGGGGSFAPPWESVLQSSFASGAIPGISLFRPLVTLPPITLIFLVLASVYLLRRGRGGNRQLLVIVFPKLGILRLDAGVADSLVTTDRTALAALFADVRESDMVPPSCDVLMIYGDLDSSGRFVNGGAALRDLIRDSGAKVVVIATENADERYTKATLSAGHGKANLVLTLARKGDATPRFLSQLFAAMGRSVPMEEAWVQSAPQDADDPANAAGPELLFVQEIGPLWFKPQVTRDG